jgi:glycosyltransferase involved in cell wall biosynthesis
MACGLPVIASPNAGASEMINDGKTGFILRDPQDSVELASLIRRIQGDDTLRLSVGKAAAQFVVTHCSWEDNVQKTIRLLESIRTNSRVSR